MYFRPESHEIFGFFLLPLMSVREETYRCVCVSVCVFLSLSLGSVLSNAAHSNQLTLQTFFPKTSSLEAMRFISCIFYLPTYPMKMVTKAEHSHFLKSYKVHFILFSSSNIIPHNLLFWCGGDRNLLLEI